jgi:hypothetical protein
MGQKETIEPRQLARSVGTFCSFRQLLGGHLAAVIGFDGPTGKVILSSTRHDRNERPLRQTVHADASLTPLARRLPCWLKRYLGLGNARRPIEVVASECDASDYPEEITPNRYTRVEAILLPARARLSGSLRLQRLFSRQSSRRSWRGLPSNHYPGWYKNKVGTIPLASSESFAPDSRMVMASRAPA